MNNICVICQDNISDTDLISPYNCNHIFHKKCINNLCKSKYKKKYNCILCQSRIKYEYKYKNFVFNNMLEGQETFDIDNYLKQWKHKTCFDKNHTFLIETIGDWNFNNIADPLFIYKYMFIKCNHCNISQNIK